MKERVDAGDIFKNRFRKPNLESNSLSTRRLICIVEINVKHCNMSEEKDDLKSFKVYKFINTKVSWHEFTLKFRVIADYREYDDIIEGKVTPPDEKEDLEILAEDNAATK